MSACIMNHTIRARLSTSTQAACSSLMKRARFAHTSAHSAPKDVPMMKPVFTIVLVAVGGGLAYGLSRSTGRIGSRFEARERTLNRTKWLSEGAELDEKMLRS